MSHTRDSSFKRLKYKRGATDLQFRSLNHVGSLEVRMILVNKGSHKIHIPSEKQCLFSEALRCRTRNPCALLSVGCCCCTAECLEASFTSQSKCSVALLIRSAQVLVLPNGTNQAEDK